MRKAFKLPNHIQPRDYQIDFLAAAMDLIQSNPTQWHPFVSPTGTGKSIMELMFLSAVEGSLMITPRIEIIAGMLEDLGHNAEDWSAEKVVAKGMEYGIYTPIRLRNILAKGVLPYFPTCLLIDECHHDLANTYQDIDMYLNGCPKVGLSATMYRGTPDQTKIFHERWGNVINQVLSLRDAVEQGYCSFPTAELWPLVDDDLVDISNGDFKVKTVEGLLNNQFDSIKNQIYRMFDRTSRLYDRPTMLTVPGANTAIAVTRILNDAGLPAMCITQDTSRDRRSKAFQSCQASLSILVQINVVSEGVNLKKLRRIIDLSPTMSPVKWVQQIGRITRPVEPGELPPEYICACRNLERHGYLMEGLFPPSKIKEAQEAFEDDKGRPIYSKRSGIRVTGLEGLGKFTTTPVHMLDGCTSFMYNLVHTEGYKRTEYIALVHPSHPEVIYGVKESAQENGEMKWGRWKLVEKLPELKNCRSAKVNPLTPKQENRWRESAEHFGLNPHKEINTREFQVLPFLMNTGLKFNH